MIQRGAPKMKNLQAASKRSFLAIGKDPSYHLKNRQIHLVTSLRLAWYGLLRWSMVEKVPRTYPDFWIRLFHGFSVRDWKHRVKFPLLWNGRPQKSGYGGSSVRDIFKAVNNIVFLEFILETHSYFTIFHGTMGRFPLRLCLLLQLQEEEQREESVRFAMRQKWWYGGYG